MKSEIEKLKERNKKVEADKAWEVSKTRRGLIAILTYIFIVIFLITIKASHPFINAIVPTIGFLLSSMTLNFFKKMWLKQTLK